MKRSAIILLHSCYWLLYLFLIFCFLLFIPGIGKQQPPLHIIRSIVAPPIILNIICPGVACFYTCYAILFKRYLSTKRFVLLSLTGIATCISCATICFFITVSFNRTTYYLSLREKTMMVVMLSILALIHGVIGLIIKGFITWYADIKFKEELNRKNFETELALVKSQINPHFLFNTINNIDVMILKDGEKASAFLNKLSDIMRFMLYETKTEQIPLQKELDYISNYVQLQQIRTSNQNYIDYHVTGNASEQQVPPMLFIPFIENAFKYADDNKSAHAVKIGFEIDKQQLLFTCSNNYSDSISSKDQGGLGNLLIEKRLSLLYPGMHKLTIDDHNRTYTVKLIVYFHAD